MKPKLDIGMAVQALKDGKKIRRENWVPEQYLFLSEWKKDKDTPPVAMIKRITFHDMSYGYVFDSKDVMALDWEVLGEDEK